MGNSKQPLLGKTQDLGTGHDQVIKHPDIDQSQRCFQILSECFVCTGWQSATAWVVMTKDDRRRLPIQSFNDHFAWIDTGLCEGPPKHFFGGKDSVLCIQKCNRED